MLIIPGFFNNFDVYHSKELILAYFLLEKEESILMNNQKKKKKKKKKGRGYRTGNGNGRYEY